MLRLKDITVYISDKCPKCNILKIKLNNKGIKYQEKIASKEEIDDILKTKNIMSLPILKIDDKYLDFTQANNWVNEQ